MIENKYEDCSYQPSSSPSKKKNNNNKLMISGETMRCRQARWILRCHMLNKRLSPEKFAYHVMLLVFLFRELKQTNCVSWGLLNDQMVYNICFILCGNSCLNISGQRGDSLINCNFALILFRQEYPYYFGGMKIDKFYPQNPNYYD